MKLTLEDKEWKEFKIYDIFSNQRGKRQIEANRKKGNTPYYSASQLNNGLTDFISNPTFKINTNAIIYSTFGDAYYVKKDFSTSDEITVLTNSNLNKFNGLFICKAINQNKSKYSFGRKAYSNKIGKDKIILPVDKEGKPDYEYMEQYTKSIIDKKTEMYKKYAESVLKDIEYKEIENLHDKEWKEFIIGKTFNILNSKPYHKKDLIVSNDNKNSIPYVSRTNRNNGVEEIIQKEEDFKVNNKNTIAFGAENATFFFQPFEYITGNKIYTINHKKINKFNGLFLQQTLNTSIKDCGFSYGQGLTGTRAKRRNILLPINEKKEPDFEYMEQYMKNITYKKIKQYLDYINKN